MYIAAQSSSYCSRTLAAIDATCSHVLHFLVGLFDRLEILTSLGLFEAKLEAFETPEPTIGSDAVLLISGYFHDFTEEQTMMLKVFPDDDLGSTAHDRKKE
ncbi:hypothetical protein BHM03_00015333 [Ensete ventricosum]|nr:hypothetical protein BHM03_00015333 [Ensete ventricosum]